jgi:hypothetical protein
MYLENVLPQKMMLKFAEVTKNTELKKKAERLGKLN